LSECRLDGVAVIAEGLVLGLDPELLGGMSKIERDAHGNVRLAEIDIGDLLKVAVRARLKKLGIDVTIASKDIGYELRCADPIPFDLEYTRDLGYCATKCLLSGGNAAMISIQAGNFVPVPFRELLDPVTGRAKIRMVDIRSTRYAIARRYMIRLRRDDFEEPLKLAKIAKTAGLSVDAFRKEFEYLIDTELPPIVFDVET
jgi:ATP-dependent phosphofructokinase / diphosphate-dependent phosphofructokinase